MHEGARTRVTSSVGLTEKAHHESSMSRYFFAMIMDVLARGIKDLPPWCILYADGFVLCSTRIKEVEKKLEG